MFWVSIAYLSLLNIKLTLAQIALYVYPVGWLALLFVSLLKFNVS